MRTEQWKLIRDSPQFDFFSDALKEAIDKGYQPTCGEILRGETQKECNLRECKHYINEALKHNGFPTVFLDEKKIHVQAFHKWLANL